jgi:indolepyruvate ferredoxin oxidoreductase, beta subunit
LRILAAYASPSLNILVNNHPLPPLNVSAGDAVYPGETDLQEAFDQLSARVWRIEATEEARQLGNPIMANMIMLGALTATGLLPLEPKMVEQSLTALLPAERGADTQRAFRKGTALASLADSRP